MTFHTISSSEHRRATVGSASGFYNGIPVPAPLDPVPLNGPDFSGF